MENATITQQIPDDETRCGRSHHVDEITGYIAVRTRFGHGKVEDVEVFHGATSYGRAMECVHALRLSAPDGEYARCDVLYADGCRGIH